MVPEKQDQTPPVYVNNKLEDMSGSIGNKQKNIARYIRRESGYNVHVEISNNIFEYYQPGIGAVMGTITKKIEEGDI